jgi:methionyl-tRNA formyltransferase
VTIGVAATASLGADVLERLAATREISFLLTRPDAPRGRGRKLGAPPAKEAAERLGVPVHQPERPELPADVDRVVVCAYGLYIPSRLLERALFLNVHPSLLPRWRGAAPVERAILAGDEETGVTIHETVAELDAGPVAAQESFTVGDDDAGAVYLRCAEVAARLLDAVLDAPRFEPQVGEATYAEKITAADRRLDGAQPAAVLERVVRALTPHIGALLELPDGTLLGVREARAVDDGPPAAVVSLDGRRPLLGCADGALELLAVHPPGRRPMSGEDYLRGLRR